MTSRALSSRVAVLVAALALAATASARSLEVRAVSTLSLLDWETAELSDSLGESHGLKGFGTVSAALATACSSRCAARLGWPSSFDVDLNGGPGQWLSLAGAATGGSMAAATGSIPSSGSTSSTFLYTLDDLTANALSSGRAGSSAAGGALAWDDLTFHGVTPGETGTLSLTLDLSAGGASSMGLGGGCLAIGSVCNPFTKTVLSGGSTTETLSTTFSLSSSAPLLVFDALYALAGSGHGTVGADVEGFLTLTLPSNVSFTAASGNGGGPAPVPLPDSAGLLLCGCVAALLMCTFRRRAVHR